MSRATPLLAAALGLAVACAQDYSSVEFERIAARLAFAEGPAWSRDGYLAFSDTPSDRVMRWVPGKGVEPLRANAQGPSGNAFDAQGRLYTCETRGRRVVRMDKSGKLETVAERWEGKRLNAPNDIAISRNGYVYFTDPAFGEQIDRRELDFYGVYRIPPKGPMTLVAKFDGRPNGVAVSADGRALYVSVADEHAIRAFELDREGMPSNQRVVVSGIAGVPGGIRLDEKGNFYVAADGIAVYNPAGKLLAAMGEGRRFTNCAFGEADYRSLFFTGGSEVFRARLEVKGY